MVVDLSSTSFSRDQPSDTEDKQSNSSDSDNDYQEKMDEVADAGLEADLNLQDVEVDISEDELESPVQRVSTLRRTKVDNKVRMKPKRDFVSAETIMLQPELKLMQLEKERELVSFNRTASYMYGQLRYRSQSGCTVFTQQTH